MPSIGSVEFMTLSGIYEDQAQTIETMTRPGIDGVQARELGKTAEPSRFIGIMDVETAGDVVTQRKAVRALRGTLIDVVDDTGETESDVLVNEARLIEPPKFHAIAVGGAETSTNRWLLTFAFRLQLTEVA